ncbi:hypothetical protein SAMN05421858_1114 [Haladaptatus litoreus]|uniref:DUF5658 domain-containing protein n=1 Tax=Haladaptatus litoreus TaxID=553468 RepID=A0A1N6XFE7_9EURY|nr:DUF5658 family protein [Haladaptatus litoreus]SIR01096.1 hypothetical protein SAMN05421858_1114 [Haladaptatus litoreus]
MSPDDPHLWSHVSVPLLVAVLGVMLGDVVTTGVGLQLGLEEGNPFVAHLLREMGLLGLVFIKAITVLLLVVLSGWTQYSRQTFRLGSLVYLIIGLLVVVSNIIAIATVG